MATTRTDCRLEAFLSPDAPDVFHGVVQANQIWHRDPYDVTTIHTDARTTFHELLARAAAAEGSGPEEGAPSGRTLLMLAESGAGKTHLMRYFRNVVHESGAGYFGYLELASPSEDYGKFILSNLIDSLNQPFEPNGETTSLVTLANAVAETPRTMSMPVMLKGHHRDKLLDALRSWDWDAVGQKYLRRAVMRATKLILGESGFQDVDPNVLGALLYLQVQDHMVKSAVTRYLRLRPLSAMQGEAVRALARPECGLTPVEMIGELAKLMWACEQRILVLCVDQLDQLLNLPDSVGLLRSALGAVLNIASVVPRSLIVLSCVDNDYEVVRKQLDQFMRSRIEQPPSPLKLGSLLESRDQVCELVSQRLSVLYETMGCEPDGQNPTYPIPEAELDKCVRMRARDVLMLCKGFQETAKRTGTIPEGFDGQIPTPAEEPVVEETERIECDWQGHLTNWTGELPADEEGQAALLRRALESCHEELELPAPIQPTIDGRFVECEGGAERMLIGICNKNPQGGGLYRQIRGLEDAARGRTIVIVRSAEFPKSAKSQVSNQIGELIQLGARRALVEDTDWRAMAALPSFCKEHASDSALTEWRKKSRPLTRYQSMQRILGIGPFGQPSTLFAGRATLRKDVEPWPEPIPVDPAPPPPKKPVLQNLLVGRREGLTGGDVLLKPGELTRHAAFLGQTGSGKTTVAMNLIEQLLLGGIPVVLVDRKGDLFNYANPQAWEGEAPTPELTERRHRLQDAVDIHAFTPGHGGGRPLAVSIVPEGTHLLPARERDMIAKMSAASMGRIMGLKNSLRDQASLGILRKAIFLLTEINDPEEILLEEIIELVGGPDSSLVNQVGEFDQKHYKHLHEVLMTLRLTREELFRLEGERLNADLLFGAGRYKRPGKTRLSILNTKFLGDQFNQEFYIAQFLLELRRWVSKNPSTELQAVVMFDEADVYLPASSKPATKEPMEDLLKRARSAGLGLFLATQSPGDLDYKSRENIRSWFLGRIKETTALKKVAPMLTQSGIDGADRLPGQGIGQFHLVREGKAERVRAGRSAIALDQLSEAQILAIARSG